MSTTVTEVQQPNRAAQDPENDLEKRISPNHDISEVPAKGPEDEDSASNHFKQDGVRRVEAITSVWSKPMLWVMFVLLYLVSFNEMLLTSVQTNLVPYITSSFGKHALLSTTSIVASILGGVLKLTIAKIIDIWGRCEGFLAMLTLGIVGIILKATCTNVEMYAAAHTMYWVGHLGMLYIIDVIIADITTLRNRMIMMAINSTPTIATVFAGSRIADLFYTHVNFRWAFGAFVIIEVVFALPVAIIFIYSTRKAYKTGVIVKKVRTRTMLQSCQYYFVQFDVIGMLLISAGWSLILLPFSLASSAPHGWRSGYIIAMIVLGVVCLGAFATWERFFAKVSFLPFKFLKDRTILGSCVLYGVMFASIFSWDSYYSSYLQVVHDLSITISGYVLNSFSLSSAIIGPFIGLLIRYTGDYKWLGVAGTPFCVLGTALLIHFRTPGADLGYLVMCQVFNGVASEIWSITARIAIMAAVDHQEIAVVLALFGLFGSIGSAIGQAIAGAIWTNILPGDLQRNLPEAYKSQWATIYGSLKVQKSYPMGSPVRDAIILSYGDVQRKMVIAGAAFTPILLICVLAWRNVNVKKLDKARPQTKGNVL